jgi:L-ascorbate metabolism protein UlaG (beta-lactamase superfamily)
MKEAHQKDRALLDDIAAARARRGTRLWWLGQSGFLLVTPTRTVLFDPYLSDSLTRKYAQTDKPHTRITERVVAPELLTEVDWITSSHNHTDHLDAETLLPLFEANPKAKLLLPRANVAFALERLGDVRARLVSTDAGHTVGDGELQFHGIPAAHNTVDRDEQGHCRYLCYVAQIGPLTVYHSGDTLWHDGLAPAVKPRQVDLALVPINGNKPERRVAGNMNGVEAAQFARTVGARLAIPHHFDMFAFNTEPPGEFEAECQRIGQPFKTLRNGEGVDL